MAAWDAPRQWGFLPEDPVTGPRVCRTTVKTLFFSPGRVCSRAPCKFAKAGEKGQSSRWAFMEEMERTSAWGLCMGSAAKS